MANVLIVDDNLDMADLSVELLKSAGHSTRKANNGEAGLLSMEAGPLPDCVVLDVEMPVLNGPGMAHRMLVHDAGEERIPIVLVSARNDLSEIAGRMGTPYFLAKVTADYGDALLEIVAKALRERRAPAPAKAAWCRSAAVATRASAPPPSRTLR